MKHKNTFRRSWSVWICPCVGCEYNRMFVLLFYYLIIGLMLFYFNYQFFNLKTAPCLCQLQQQTLHSSLRQCCRHTPNFDQG